MNQKPKSIFRKKAHKAIAMMLSLAILLTMIPSLALKSSAATVYTRTEALDLSATSISYQDSSGNIKTADPTTQNITDTAEGWTWYRYADSSKGYSDYTLELNGINMDAGSGIITSTPIAGGYTIVVNGVNTVTVTSGRGISNGLYSFSPITIKSTTNGTLNINDNASDMSAIAAGRLTTDHVNFNVNCSSDSRSALNSITMPGGTGCPLVFNGGTAILKGNNGPSDAGLRGSTVSVEGGAVVTSSGNYGINGTSINIADGVLHAVGNTSAFSTIPGLGMGLVAIDNANSQLISTGTDLSTYKDVTICSGNFSIGVTVHSDTPNETLNVDAYNDNISVPLTKKIGTDQYTGNLPSGTYKLKVNNGDTGTSFTASNSNSDINIGIYKLSLEKDSGISSVSGDGYYVSGAKVRITAVLSSGYTFDQWQSADTSLVADISDLDGTLIMPSSSVTLTAKSNAKATPATTVTLNKPQTTDATNTKYTFTNATVTNNENITSITFTGTNSTTVASTPTSPAPSSSLSSIDGTTRVYTYVFENGITSAQAQSFIRGIVFNYAANAEISVTVDANKTVLPTGANITKLSDSSGKDHYYMYVPSNFISWTDAYNAAKGYTYMGMKGYLATVTSSDEDQVLTNISTTSAWSAGTRLLDASANKFQDPNSVTLTTNNASYYYWACGPEAGTIFYNGITASSHNGPSYSGYNGAYNNWGTTQPDAISTGETCVQVNWPYDTATTDMRWNDLPNAGLPYLGLVKGYFVEFSNYVGGMDSTYASDKTAVNLYNLEKDGIDTQGAALTLTAPTNLVYNGADKAYTATVSNVTLAAGTDYTLTYTGRNSTTYSSTTAPKNVGDYTVTFALTDSGKAKCSVTGTLSDNFTIKPAALTVTPNSGQSKLFGTDDPANLTFTYGGNISGETPAFSGTLSRTGGNAIGNYGITHGNLALADGTGGFLADNYSLVFSAATVNFAVSPYTPSERAVLCSPNGNNGWFKDGVADITLTAPAGFTISTTGTLATDDWSSFITIDKTDGNNKSANYYMKRTSDGAISSALTSDSYKVDTTAPSNVTISYGTKNFNDFLNTITFGLFFKSTVTVTLAATDTGSTVEKFKYTLNGTEQTIAATNGRATFNISPQYKGNISNIQAIDSAGNESAQKSTEYFTVDNQNPTVPTIDPNGYTANTWTTDSVKLTVSGASASSGIAEYQYSTDNGATWSDMTTTEKTDSTATEPYNAVQAELTINTDMNGTVLVRAVSNTGTAGNVSSVIVKHGATPAITPNEASPVPNPSTSSAMVEHGATSAVTPKETSSVPNPKTGENSGDLPVDITPLLLLVFLSASDGLVLHRKKKRVHKTSK